MKRRNIWIATGLILLMAGMTRTAGAQDKTAPPRKETGTERKKRLLANVRRLVVVAPYFGVPLPDAKTDPKMTDAQRKQQERYRDYLRKLEASAREHLPLRLAARTMFQIVPLAEADDALKALTLTPQSLFQNSGLMRGTNFPLPNAENVARFAAQSKADAVLITVLDAPRRDNGRVLFDPLTGLSGEPPKVRSKAAFYLLLPDGAEVLRDYVEALQPVTSGSGHGRDYLLIDWTEAQDVTLEDFMDELSRYAP